MPQSLTRVAEEELKTVRVGTKNGDTLVVAPRALVEEADRAALARFEPHVLALLAYEPPSPEVQ